MKSQLEEILAMIINASGLPPPEREYVFHPPRKWRFDFAYPDIKLAVEMEGGVWIKGRHNRPMGFIKDQRKYNQAVLDGWRILKFTRDDITSGYAIETLETALRMEKSNA